MSTDLNRLCPGCMNLLPQIGAICPKCNWPNSAVDGDNAHLPPGTRLKMSNRDYMLGKSLGQGGFGIVYVAWDVIKDQKVAIKEFFPSSLVQRTYSYSVAVKVNASQEVYRKFLKNFKQEYKNMVKFNNDPNTVNVLDYIEANGTAYIVMEFIDGKTLSKKIDEKKSKGELYSLDEIVVELKPIAEVLDRIHNTGLIHRDISPDNIMFPNSPGSSVKLMDFGAAREWDPKHPTTIAVMKDGYAPPEQYLVAGDAARKGAWTDVYSFAATIYTAITGNVPISSNTRGVNGVDLLQKPSSIISINPAQENVLLKGLAIRYVDRYQTIRDFFNDLCPQILIQTGHIQSSGYVPLPSPNNVSVVKKILPWAAAAIAIIALIIVIDLNDGADRGIKYANTNLSKLKEKRQKYHSTYEELCVASKGFYIYPPIVALKAGQGVGEIKVCKENGNIENLTAYRSSSDITGKWEGWNKDSKVAIYKIKAGNAQGLYTVTFYDSKENTSCAAIVVVK